MIYIYIHLIHTYIYIYYIYIHTRVFLVVFQGLKQSLGVFVGPISRRKVLFCSWLGRSWKNWGQTSLQKNSSE